MDLESVIGKMPPLALKFCGDEDSDKDTVIRKSNPHAEIIPD